MTIETSVNRSKRDSEGKETTLPLFFLFIKGSVENTFLIPKVINAIRLIGFTSKGNYCIYEQENRVDVIELPIRKWTNDYKKFLHEMMDGDEPDVDDITEHHTNNRVHFKIMLNKGVIHNWNYLGFERVLKLSKELST
jgi:hypothetical protein